MSALQNASSVSVPVPGVSFNPAELKAGKNIDNQLNAWMSSSNPSIFVQWVPDEFQQNDAYAAFHTVGKISRVEFVPKKNANGEQIGRMMFVHFECFYDEDETASNVAASHPNPHEIRWNTTNRYGVKKNYILKCRVNLRPIPKVEFTVSQLADMMETMRNQLTTKIEELERKISLLTGVPKTNPDAYMEVDHRAHPRYACPTEEDCM